MSNTIQSKYYAICKENCNVNLITTRNENLSHTSRTRNLLPGMMICILDYHQDNFCSIQICNYNNDKLWQNDIYFCKIDSLQIVEEDIWPFLIAINLPYDRLNYCKDYHALEYLKTIKIDDEVTVRGSNFNNQNTTFHCIVKNICPVPELGPGKYFCLEILVIFYIIIISLTLFLLAYFRLVLLC